MLSQNPSVSSSFTEMGKNLWSLSPSMTVDRLSLVHIQCTELNHSFNETILKKQYHDHPIFLTIIFPPFSMIAAGCTGGEIHVLFRWSSVSNLQENFWRRAESKEAKEITFPKVLSEGALTNWNQFKCSHL